jgi:hypothetical protein
MRATLGWTGRSAFGQAQLAASNGGTSWPVCGKIVDVSAENGLF